MDVTIGDIAAKDYAAYYDQFATEAQMAALSGNAPLTRRRLQHNAEIARRAMLAELHDADMPPEPKPHRCPCKPCRDWIETKGEGRTSP